MITANCDKTMKQEVCYLQKKQTNKATKAKNTENTKNCILAQKRYKTTTKKRKHHPTKQKTKNLHPKTPTKKKKL